MVKYEHWQSEGVRPAVEIYQGYMRKYWSRKRETLTLKYISTTVETAKIDTRNFRNEIRAFLWKTPEDLEDIIEEIATNEEAILHNIPEKEIWAQKSIEVRAYEKEFFYLKCMQLEFKPRHVLRALLERSFSHTWEEVLSRHLQHRRDKLLARAQELQDIINDAENELRQIRREYIQVNQGKLQSQGGWYIQIYSTVKNKRYGPYWVYRWKDPITKKVRQRRVKTPRTDVSTNTR